MIAYIARFMGLYLLCFGLAGCINGGTANLSSEEATGEPEPASSLILVEYRNHPNFRISQMDLDSNEFMELFNIPNSGWVNQLALSPDGRRLALSYTPPPENADMPMFGKADISLMMLDEWGLPTNPEPVPLITQEESGVFYYNPTWTPDGQTLFYIHTTPNPLNESGINLMLMRYDLETQHSVEIAADGIWPRVSPDGQRITYIHVNPKSMERSLVTTDLDGNEQVELIPAGEFFDIDSPLFSGDSQWVYFAAAPQGNVLSNDSSAIPWWLRLLGTRRAAAHSNHNVPSDWWRVPAMGGEPEQLTDRDQQLEIVLYGAFDYVTEQLYYSTMNGLFVMDSAGNKIEQLDAARYYRTFAVR